MTGPPPSPTPMACQTCHRPLQVEQRLDGTVTGYDHAPYDRLHRGVDHDPVPVAIEVADQVSICDFCSSPRAAWAMGATDFVMASPDAGFPGEMSRGNWSACAPCLDDVLSGNWEGVARRFDENHPEMSEDRRQLVRPWQQQLWEAFGHHFTGEIEPLGGGRLWEPPQR